MTDAAVELLPDVDAATITIEYEDGHVETAAATGSTGAGQDPGAAVGPASELDVDTAVRLDRLQQGLAEGPAVDVIDSPGWTTGPPAGDDVVADAEPGGVPDPGLAPAVTASDLSRDERYPLYGAAAARTGIRAQVAVVLFDTVRSRGVLNMYSLRSGAFDDTVVLTDLFAHHSATALAYAADHEDHETTVTQRRTVGQALGIVMERYKLTEANAFALLQETAEHRAVSVRLVAQELVAHAEGAGSPT
ncbi:MAG: ANTAR domain-containing protein [Nocardioidaceae bacterium]|nr:ANTAR domain-containing protein [Nocardioidaceae bacterium]